MMDFVCICAKIEDRLAAGCDDSLDICSIIHVSRAKPCRR